MLLLKLLNHSCNVNVPFDKHVGEELNLLQVFMNLSTLILFHIIAELLFYTNVSVIMRNTGCYYYY